MEPMVELPSNDTPVSSTSRPNHSQISDSTYAATLSGGDIVQAYRDSRYAFDTTGESPIVKMAQERWKAEQDVSNKHAVASIISDPAVDTITKQSVLAEYARTGFISSSLRDKYIQTLASRDVSVSSEDRRAQDIYVQTLNQRNQMALDEQGVLDKFAASLDDSTAMAYLGILRDLVPGVNLGWNYSVAKTAKAVGVDKTAWDSVKSFLFTGSANKQIKEAYDALPLEQRKEFVTKLVESYKGSPSFDFNKWVDITAQTQADHPAWAVGLDNAASALNLVGLGWLVKMGTSAFKYEGLIRPRVNPVSPMGAATIANPRVAKDMAVAAMAEDSGQLAEAAGTTRASLIGDFVLPKINKSIQEVYPNIAHDLETLDANMGQVFRDTKFDASLIDYEAKDIDMRYIGQVLKEVKGPTYQQANSVVEEEARVLKGTMVFGRDDVSGWTKKADATRAAKQLQNAILSVSKDTPGLVDVIKTGKEYRIAWNFEKNVDPFEHLVFGTDSVGAKVTIPWFNGKEYGFRMDSLARSSLGRWIWPATMRMDEWVPKSAALADMKAAKVEHDFILQLQSNVARNQFKKELLVALQESEAANAWKTPAELSSMFPHIPGAGQEELYRAYSYYRRLGDYEYNWANRWDRANKANRGYGAIYNKEGTLVGYGTEKVGQAETPKMVWDVATNKAIPMPKDLNGKKFIRFETPMNQAGARFEYGLVNELHPLPPHTLPKLEVYIPRRNMENWYVKATPKELTINGILVKDKKRLEQHQQVVGAGDTREEAATLAARMQEDFPNHTVEVKQDRLDTPDAILTDYRVYRESLEFGKKRGERLPTLTGTARLEDPLVAMTRAIKTTVRLDAWKDYTDAFKTNWMKAFGEFVNGHEFPSVKTDLIPPKGATPETLAKFRSAERLFEQFTNQAYKTTIGDELWKSFFFNMSNVLEKLPVKLPHQVAKDIGREGNLVVKVPKMLSTKLFIDTNIPRQWFVQPQQVLEIAAMDKNIASHIGMNAPQVLAAIVAKAGMLDHVHDPIYKALRATAKMSPAEFDATVEAIYKSGIPQSVDLNMMLHGMFNDVDRALVESAPRAAWEKTKAVVNAPFKAGRSLGYTPAELGNQVAMWMAAQERWKLAHPGVNWNTPNNIAQISGDAWDIAHSMSTRAGAFPYQEGAASLLMQFVAVQHKAFMQMFSSTTLSATERAKIAASRMALYGMYGVPGGLLVNEFIQKYADESTKKEWDGYARGMVDWVTNNLLHALVDGPDENSNVAVSHALSPLPDGAPYFDTLRELMKYGQDSKGNLRLPFVNSTSSVYRGLSDMLSLFRTNALDTDLALERTARLAGETMSGYNNWAKFMMLRNMGDKMDKMGNPLGLTATHAEMYAQLFGIITQQEVAMYAAKDAQKQREDYIKQRSQDIYRQLMGMRVQFGKEEFNDYVSRMQALSSLEDADVRADIQEEVMKLDRESLLTKNESLMMYIIQHHKQENDRWLSSMIAHMTASDNPQAQRNIEALKKEGLLNAR